MILLYDRTSDLVCIDEARKHLFTKKGRAMDAIPPTRAALVSTFKGQYTKVVIAGERRSKFPLIFPLQETGDGLTPITRNLCGLPDLKQANHPGSYCAVAARKGAEGSASAKEQL